MRQRIGQWVIGGVLGGMLLVGCQSAASVSRSSSNIEPERLWEVAQQWVGVPYRYGGKSEAGIDCSALAQRILQVFGIRVPRTVAQQFAAGKPIPKDAVQPGDLLFFAFRRKPSHVGVYLDNGFFVHASSSAGVIISSLRNSYYFRHWVAVRRFYPAIVEYRPEE